MIMIMNRVNEKDIIKKLPPVCLFELRPQIIICGTVKKTWRINTSLVARDIVIIMVNFSYSTSFDAQCTIINGN